MFKRIVLEDWHNILPMAAFFFFFAIFIYLSYRALRMKRQKIDEIANLPFEDEDSETPLEEAKRHE